MAMAASKARYSPPAVSFDIGAAASTGAVVLVPVLLGLGSVAVARAGLMAPQSWLAGGVLLAMGLLAGYRELFQAPAKRLEWDRQGWSISVLAPRTSLSEVVSPCVPSVAIDLQNLLLLRVETGAQTTSWLWLSARGDREKWHRLRCALFGWRQP